MLSMRRARPGLATGGRAAAGTVAVADRPRLHSTTCRQPEALAIRKRGRWCVVAKLTYFDGGREPILAVVWRGQRGTKTAISMPVVAIEYARRAGATRFYLRDDRAMTMLTCDLSTFDRGRLQSDGERYIPLNWLEPVPWRAWAFAETTVQLQAHLRPEPAGPQPQLPGLGG